MWKERLRPDRLGIMAVEAKDVPSSDGFDDLTIIQWIIFTISAAGNGLVDHVLGCIGFNENRIALTLGTVWSVLLTTFKALAPLTGFGEGYVQWPEDLFDVTSPPGEYRPPIMWNEELRPDLLGMRTNGVDDLVLVTAVAEVKKMIPGDICWDEVRKSTSAIR